jgi:hypothetical protein
MAILTQNKAKLCNFLIITLDIEKNAIVFAENRQKSPKIVIITSTPGKGRTTGGLGLANADPKMLSLPLILFLNFKVAAVISTKAEGGERQGCQMVSFQTKNPDFG